MTSEILTELRALSVKVDTIQNEISHLHQILVDHLVTDEGQASKSHDLLQLNERVNPKPRLAYTLNEIKRPIKCHGQSLANSSTDYIALPKLKMKETSKIPIKDTVFKNQERTAQCPNRSFRECREECLRKAIQQNIVLLVDNLPYSENDILDMLIENECLTETECSDLLNNGSRKDRVRNLVRIIKGRTFKVIKTFVECLRKLHPEVATSIWQVYDKLIKDKKNYNRQCTFCALKRSTDLKFIADHIWSIGAISDDLYDAIVDERTDRETLWTKLADECNIAPSKVRQNALRKLTEALAKKGQYRELVLKLSKMSVLKCACVKMDVESVNLSVSVGIRVPDIVVVDSEENTTVSPLSTPRSSRSFADAPEIVSEDDEFPVNEHENYFLSPWTAENDRDLYTSYFGIRKSSVYTQVVVNEDFRKSRSNSFGKNTAARGSLQTPAKRRASMFM